MDTTNVLLVILFTMLFVAYSRQLLKYWKSRNDKKNKGQV